MHRPWSQRRRTEQTWLIYVDTINVGDALQNRDRLVSALVEKRDERGRSVNRARQYTTGCYTHGDGMTRWGENGRADEWTWGGPLVLDILATRICQYAWDRVEPDAGIEFPLKHAVSLPRKHGKRQRTDTR